MNRTKSLCLILFIFYFLHCTSGIQKIVNIPLDERFATRVTFLNLARMTPYNISTLPQPLLPKLKKWSSADSILNWIESESRGANGAIISL